MPWSSAGCGALTSYSHGQVVEKPEKKYDFTIAAYPDDWEKPGAWAIGKKEEYNCMVKGAEFKQEVWTVPNPDKLKLLCENAEGEFEEFYKS